MVKVIGPDGKEHTIGKTSDSEELQALADPKKAFNTSAITAKSPDESSPPVTLAQAQRLDADHDSAAALAPGLKSIPPKPSGMG